MNAAFRQVSRFLAVENPAGVDTDLEMRLYRKEQGTHVIGPAGSCSIADVTALFCGGACRIAPSSAGGLPALCPADLQI
jgi:hypothetical protein